MACSQYSDDITFTSSTGAVEIRTKTGVARELDISAAGLSQQVIFDYDTTNTDNDCAIFNGQDALVKLKSNRDIEAYGNGLQVTLNEAVKSRKPLLFKGDETETRFSADAGMSFQSSQKVLFKIADGAGLMDALEVTSDKVRIKASAGAVIRFEETLDLTDGRLVIQTMTAPPSSTEGYVGQMVLVKLSNPTQRLLYIKTGATTWKSVALST